MKEQSTTKGFAILSAAGMIVKILSLVYVPFLLRIVGPLGYGYYYAAYQIFVLVYVLTNSGIPVAISKLVSELVAAENYKDAVKAFKIARALLLGLGMVMGLLMLVMAYPIAKATNNLEAYLALMALSPTIVITSVMSAYRGYFQGRGNMEPTAVSQIIEQIINTTFSLVFAALLISVSIEAGVAGATVGTTLGALAACIYLIWVYEKNRKSKLQKPAQGTDVKRLSNRQIFRKLISYGIPMTLCVGLQNVGTVIDMANVKSRLLASGFDNNVATIKYGFLGKYNTLIFVPIAFITALSAAALPAISGAAVQNSRKLVQSKINQVMRLCFLVSIPSAVGLAILSKQIFTVVFKSAEGYELLLYGSIVVVLMAVVQIQTTILQGLGKLYVVTMSLILGILVKIAANYFLVARPALNINGVIVGNILCYGIPLFLNNRVLRKTLKIRINLFRSALKPIIAAAFMGLVTYIIQLNLEALFHHPKSLKVQAVPLAVSILAAVFVYSYSLILNGGITKEDLDSMSPFWRQCLFIHTA